MKIIADSSSTRTEWVLADGDKIVEHVFTEGLNPYFQTRKEISHSIRLNLPDAFSAAGGNTYISTVPAAPTLTATRSWKRRW